MKTSFMTARRHTLSGLISAALFAACMPTHVDLRAPEASAPEAERVRAYEALRPAGNELVVQRRTTYDSHGRYTGYSESRALYLILGDGRRVVDPHDLLAVVPAESATVRHVQVMDKAARSASTKAWIGYGVAVAGLVTAAVGLAKENWTVVGVGAGVGGAGALFGWIAPMSDVAAAGEAQVAAFDSYDADLVNRLALDAAALHKEPVVHDKASGEVATPKASEPVIHDKSEPVIHDKAPKP